MRNRLQKFVLFCLILTAFGGITAYAATTLGSEEDPLITLSYLNEVLRPELEAKTTETANAAVEELEAQIDAEYSGAFQAVSVAAGKNMTCEAGCEVLVRSGDVRVSGAVLDLTTGETVTENTGLYAHHLYMTAEDDAIFTAVTETALMVRGEYVLPALTE
ncbi:MAG: hypothetical protein J6J04_03480 [Oscillospiraceae bacterium]|nr:hypothetical protein [Oscillospiraceae bacterium]